MNMIKISAIFILGILIIIIPFTGFPNESGFPVKNILYIVCGLLVTTLSFLIRKELEKVIKHLHTEVEKTDIFLENNIQKEENKE